MFLVIIPCRIHAIRQIIWQVQYTLIEIYIINDRHILKMMAILAGTKSDSGGLVIGQTIFMAFYRRNRNTFVIFIKICVKGL